jgi:DNA replication protein DnaC
MESTCYRAFSASTNVCQFQIDEWGGVVPDPRLVAAIVDRVTFNAHIIETGTESYRLRSTKARAGRAENPRAPK